MKLYPLLLLSILLFIAAYEVSGHKTEGKEKDLDIPGKISGNTHGDKGSKKATVKPTKKVTKKGKGTRCPPSKADFQCSRYHDVCKTDHDCRRVKGKCCLQRGCGHSCVKPV